MTATATTGCAIKGCPERIPALVRYVPQHDDTYRLTHIADDEALLSHLQAEHRDPVRPQAVR